MIVALLAIILWFAGGYKQAHAKDDRFSLPAILLASWIISGAAFGVYFFVFRPAGLFDISIERLLFSMILFFLVAGLFNGKVRFQTNSAIEIIMGIFILVCILSMMRVGFVPVSPEFVSPWFVFITGYFFPFIVFIFAKDIFVRYGLFRIHQSSAVCFPPIYK
jgi:hypothetical protein